MFKYTLAATLDEMDREGITVAECPLRSMRCLSLQNGRIVGINTARFDSSAEVRTALIHEDGPRTCRPPAPRRHPCRRCRILLRDRRFPAQSLCSVPRYGV